MRSFVALCAILAACVCFPFQAVAKPKQKGGVWRGDQKGFLIYLVDPRTRICLAAVAGVHASGVTTVPCESLVRDPDWQPIITWVRPAADQAGIE